MPKGADPCQKQACAIQTCLDANNYQESQCEDVLQAMIKCCIKWEERSICCSGFTKQVKLEKKKTETK